MMSEHRWPDDYAALRRGEGCPVCGHGADETPHGLRVFEGRWVDGYLGRYPVRPGYALVIWKGRHLAEPTEPTEPTELSAEEAAGFWSEVASVVGAVELCDRPARMKLAQPGQRRAPPARPPGTRPLDNARAGGPVEAEAFDVASTPAIAAPQLRAEAAELRAHLRG